MKNEEESEEQQDNEEKESLGMRQSKADDLLASKPTWAEFKTSVCWHCHT